MSDYFSDIRLSTLTARVPKDGLWYQFACWSRQYENATLDISLKSHSERSFCISVGQLWALASYGRWPELKSDQWSKVRDEYKDEH